VTGLRDTFTFGGQIYYKTKGTLRLGHRIDAGFRPFCWRAKGRRARNASAAFRKLTPSIRRGRLVLFADLNQSPQRAFIFLLTHSTVTDFARFRGFATSTALASCVGCRPNACSKFITRDRTTKKAFVGGSAGFGVRIRVSNCYTELLRYRHVAATKHRRTRVPDRFGRIPDSPPASKKAAVSHETAAFSFPAQF